MKSSILLFIVLFISINVLGQNTIKFLGIPIDGTKKEMISQLQAKGFEYNSYADILKGEFNGKDVNIYVQTINNKVWRIGVIDARSSDETNIKIRFNTLFDQFINNGKYYSLVGSKISEKDNISYNISVNNKRYQASFGLLDASINGHVWYMIAEEYGSYRIVMYYENNDNAANGDDL